MSESLRARIEREAEEKYPLYTDEEIENTQYELPRSKKIKRNERNIDRQACYISAATPWAEKLEQIREEIDELQKTNRELKIENDQLHQLVLELTGESRTREAMEEFLKFKFNRKTS